jgi:hypothetical protein
MKENIDQLADEKLGPKRDAVDLRNMQHYQGLLEAAREKLKKEKNRLEMMLIEDRTLVDEKDIFQAIGVYSQEITIIDYLENNKDYNKLAKYAEGLQAEIHKMSGESGTGQEKVLNNNLPLLLAMENSVEIANNFREQVDKYVGFLDQVFNVRRR